MEQSQDEFFFINDRAWDKVIYSHRNKLTGIAVGTKESISVDQRSAEVSLTVATV